MPADYESTARALSLPVTEPEESESSLFTGIRPPWSHSPISRRGSISLSTREAAGFRDRTINQALSVYRGVLKHWSKMTVIQKILAALAALLLAGLGVGAMILAGQIFVWLGPKAEQWERSPLAYILLWISVILVSFPPMVGWTTIGTVAGFLFGFWKGYAFFLSRLV
jgi:ABC-type dipeptide/oligopeptide/nickel transport system permease component